VWVEVNNTFGGHDDYCVVPGDGQPLAPLERHLADKTLHVSPFFQIEGRYAFRFDVQDAGQFSVRIDYLADGQKTAFSAFMQGSVLPSGSATLWRVILSTGLLTFAVVWRIHWHALRLWLKGVPFFGSNGRASGGETAKEHSDE